MLQYLLVKTWDAHYPITIQYKVGNGDEGERYACLNIQVEWVSKHHDLPQEQLIPISETVGNEWEQSIYDLNDHHLITVAG